MQDKWDKAQKIKDLVKCKVENTGRVGIRKKRWKDRSDYRCTIECKNGGIKEEY